MSTKYTRNRLRNMNRDQVADVALNEFGIDLDPATATKQQLIDKVLENQEARKSAASLETGPESPESSDSDDQGSTHDGEDQEAPEGDSGVEHDQIIVEAQGDPRYCVLFEKHALHPGGEAYLRGGDVGVVGRTAAVLKKLGTGLIEAEG